MNKATIKPKKTPMTMTDIARISGVARSTVHAVLTNKAWVSKETRQQVMTVVERYHYQPNRMASALMGHPSHLIGLILRDATNPYNASLIAGVNSVLVGQNYNTLLVNTLDRHDLEKQAVQVALGYQVDGLIMAPLQLSVDLQYLWTLRNTGKPFATLGKVPGMETNHVRVDEERVGYLATEHLIQKGHRHIYHLRGPTTALAAEERLQGYRSALLKHQIHVNDHLVVQTGTSMKEGFAAAEIILRRAEEPVAIFCYNDLVAAGVYKAAQQLGLKIPDDVSVVGVDDLELSAVFGPPLTTIAQPSFSMGAGLAELVLKGIRAPDEGQAAVSRQYDTQLIERASVKNIK